MSSLTLRPACGKRGWLERAADTGCGPISGTPGLTMQGSANRTELTSTADINEAACSRFTTTKVPRSSGLHGRIRTLGALLGAPYERLVCRRRLNPVPVATDEIGPSWWWSGGVERGGLGGDPSSSPGWGDADSGDLSAAWGGPQHGASGVGRGRATEVPAAGEGVRGGAADPGVAEVLACDAGSGDWECLGWRPHRLRPVCTWPRRSIGCTHNDLSFPERYCMMWLTPPGIVHPTRGNRWRRASLVTSRSRAWFKSSEAAGGAAWSEIGRSSSTRPRSRTRLRSRH